MFMESHEESSSFFNNLYFPLDLVEEIIRISHIALSVLLSEISDLLQVAIRESAQSESVA